MTWYETIFMSGNYKIYSVVDPIAEVKKDTSVLSVNWAQSWNGNLK